jgi:exosortase/archaeosortase family protein
VLTGSARRRWAVASELLVAGGICVLGFRYGAAWMQAHEAAWVVAFLHLCRVDAVSGVLPGHVLIFRPGAEILDAVVTPSCSSILSLLGLAALTATVLRSRRWHAAWGLLAASVAVLVANDLRLAASTMAGVWWGRGTMILFHDWVGTLWNFAATLGGFLLMVSLTLPESRRAEQDLAGRHTARRPSGWERPGLGYRASTPQESSRHEGISLTGLFYRYLLPASVTRRLAARREAGRIDYRLGHLPAAERAERVRALAAEGLGTHTATLLAVATYDTDPAVLDALADGVAARQWEPVTTHRVAALRLWARGWRLSGRPAGAAPSTPALPAGVPVPRAAVGASDDGTRRLAQDLPRPPVPSAGPTGSAAPAPAVPRSFARPARGRRLFPTEDMR